MNYIYIGGVVKKILTPKLIFLQYVKRNCQTYSLALLLTIFLHTCLKLLMQLLNHCVTLVLY